MKMEQLRVFDAVVRTGSFAKAASELLKLSQPAVSMTVAQLEAELGFQLFDRQTYRPTLTHQGKVFYAQVQPLLVHFAQVGEFGRFLAAGKEPELTIVIEGYSLPQPLLQRMPELIRQHPETRFQLSSVRIGQGLELLLQRTAQLCILPWLADPPQVADLERQEVGQFEISTLVHPELLSDLPDGPLQPADLRQKIQVIERIESPFFKRQPLGLVPECHPWRVDDLMTKKQLICAGVGFGMLPHFLVADELRCGTLIPFDRFVGYQHLAVPVCAVRLKDAQLGPVQQALWDLLAPQ